MAFWLMKSEPDVYGIEHLASEGSTLWDGIRNYQARNYMRSMQVGDQAFFYHSNAKPPGIIGLMEVVATGLTDPSQFDPASAYYDPASKPEAPRWDCVRLAYRRTFSGEQSPMDLESALQLIYLLFTQTVKPDPEDLNVRAERTKAFYRLF